MTFNYPEPAKRRIGAKVKWYYYRTEGEALAASEIAKREAIDRETQGYDFGFQSPGSIRHDGGGAEYAGLWEVCLP